MINVSYMAEIDVLSMYSCPGVCLFVSARENVLFLLLFAFIHALSFLVLNVCRLFRAFALLSRNAIHRFISNIIFTAL